MGDVNGQHSFVAQAYQVGDYVRHDEHGRGKIRAIADPGGEPSVVIDFEDGEARHLLLRYAPMVRDTSMTSRLVTGGPFVLDAPDHVPAIWGSGSEVLWSEGESLMIGGPPGVGKTTLTGQLVRGRLGIAGDVLGWPVEPGRRILYLAMDRPAQIARALRRVFDEHERDLLDQQLVVWPGPPPYDLAKRTDTLLDMCAEVGADTVILDSLKDAALGLTEDEVGAGYNRARQRVLTEGVQVVELHHQVKRGPNGGRPNTLADVYGSAWLTAGAGSVVLLWGSAGDPIVELIHLKQPAEEIGPLKIIHDHTAGRSEVWHGVDLVKLAGHWSPSGSGGRLTAKAAAAAMFEADKPDRNQVEKARRRLDRLVRDGFLMRNEGSTGGASGGVETIYAAVDLRFVEEGA